MASCFGQPQPGPCLPEIRSAADRFVVQKMGYGEVQQVLKAFGQHLDDHGFVAYGNVWDRTLNDDLTGGYALCLRQSWKHPDAETPFQAELVLYVRTSGTLRGQVVLELALKDRDTLADGPGMLHGRPFRKQVLLQGEAGAIPLSLWKDWIQRGLDKLKPETFGPLFERAMEHLEEVTTP
jgi:hypothetical protein